MQKDKIRFSCEYSNKSCILQRKIKVFGGTQLRPNVHIDDMVDSYLAVLKAKFKKINGEIFNVGFKNQCK